MSIMKSWNVCGAQEFFPGISIAAVIVTYNRIDWLRKTLKAYESQTCLPDWVIVVNNCSNDGTYDYLQEWERSEHAFRVIVLNLETNLGGSGGFYYGIQKAMETGSDWILIGDDDAIPDTDAVHILKDYVASHDVGGISAVCTAVNNDGRNEGIHRCRLRKTPLGYIERYVPEGEYSADFTCDIYSFVGVMMKRSALELAGLPRKDFFIYNDDYEHSVRLAKTGKIICVPRAVFYHRDNLVYEKKATWRDYYATRNAVVMHSTHFGKLYGALRGLRRLAVALTSRNPVKVRVICDGISDAYKGKLGISEKYYPGWKQK